MRDIRDLQNEYNQAELQGNQVSLERLLASGFKGVGPKGFILDKTAWIARLTHYKYLSLQVTDQIIQPYHEVTIIWNIQRAKASYHRETLETKLQATQVWLRFGNTWQLAAIQFSEVLAT